MSLTARLILVAAAIFAAAAVLCGAAASHWVGGVGRAAALAATAAQYAMVHALGLLGLGALAASLAPVGVAGGALRGAAMLFAIGIVLFSGGLLAVAVTGDRRYGAVTPFGGIAFLLGWLALALFALKARRGHVKMPVKTKETP